LSVAVLARYVFTLRLAARVACGELAVEPVLGRVRVASVRRDADDGIGDEFVYIGWRDESGPGAATGRYPDGRTFLVRMPAPTDRVLIQRGIDQAVWRRRVVSHDIARLIAAHLHFGCRSGLYRFAVDGGVEERVYKELEMIAAHRMYARVWADALARYCLARDDTGPMPQWAWLAMADAEMRAEQRLRSGGVDVTALTATSSQCRVERSGRYRTLLARKRIPTETAARLIDAAFLLGVATARRRTLAATVEERLLDPDVLPAGEADRSSA
jgi:hypothetical protein